MRYPGADHSIVWHGTAAADANGVARVRVPYATDRPNGDGVADGAAGWTFGARTGRVQIPDAVVTTGGVVTLE